MKKILFFVFAFLLINFVSAAQLRINPSKLEFNGNINERLCKNIYVSSDYNGYIIGQSKWSEENSTNLKDYNFDSEYFNLNLEFPEKIKVYEMSQKNQVCITSRKTGNYFGALLYNTEKSSAGVGIWIYVNIKENNGNENSLSKISGNVVNDNPNNNSNKNDNAKIILLTIPSIFLFVILMGLVLFNRKK